MTDINGNMTKKHDTTQLQFLRFIAFVFIYLFHADAFAPELSKKLYIASAVTFFFVLSGFVSGYSYCNREARLDIRNILQPAWKKIKKFYPLYLLTTLVALAYSDILNTIAYHNFSSIKGLPTKFVECLFLIQSWFPTGYFSFNGVGWFLSTLVFLSLFTTPVIWFVKKQKKESIAVSLFLVMVIDVIFHFSVRNTNNEFWNYIFPPARLGDYVIGIVFGCVFRSFIDNNPDIIKNSTALFTFMEVSALVLFIISFFSDYNPAWLTRDILWIPLSIFLIVIFAFGRGLISKVFRIRVFVLLGDLSFECYMLHQVVLWVFLTLCHIRDVSLLGNATGIIMTMSILLLLSWMLHGRPSLFFKKQMASSIDSSR